MSRHLIVCREFPPAPSGGIGTYAQHISHLLSARGSEIVHVIGQRWEGADREIETHADGRLVIHRVPFQNWRRRRSPRPHPDLDGAAPQALFASDLPGQAFSWQASILAERLVEEEAIDVIEAEDYEAPLYFFLVRRTLGLGPKRTPPCFIHLHSPTRFIARHNERDPGSPEIVAARRVEDYCIAAADALVCPSTYLARQAETEYGLSSGSVEVIPLPVGDMPSLARNDSTWSGGSIVYLGRLERRKGVIEWLEAASRLAVEQPGLHFDFVGANVLGATPASGSAAVERLIPAEVRARFRFHGHRDRAGVLEVLREARIGVVPSRWENFPNSCVEMMASGLPVLATCEGGMAEMVQDGASGWLVPTASVDGLAGELRRAVSTPPGRLAGMGAEAARRIREVCNNERTVDRHVRFRQSVIDRGAGRSLTMPANFPWAGHPVGEPLIVPEAGSEGEGIAVVMTGGAESRWSSIEDVNAQTLRPACAVRVGPGPAGSAHADEPEHLEANPPSAGLTALSSTARSVSAMRNEAVAWIRENGIQPLAYLFTTDMDRLEPDLVRRCADVFEHRPEVGLIGAWTTDREPRVPQWPCFPYQWLSNDITGPFAVRAAALDGAGGFRTDLSGGLETWDLVNAVMASGWVAVNVPEILSHRQAAEAAPSLAASTGPSGRRKVLERFSELVARDAVELVLMLESDRTGSVRQAVRLISAELEAFDSAGGSDRPLTSKIVGRLAALASRTVARIPSKIGGSHQ